MTALHPLLQKELRQLPSCCGVIDWVRESSLAFVISVPPSLGASDLKRYTVHYFPAQLHTYPQIGTILDLPLALSAKIDPTLPISLLLNLSDAKQRPFLHQLAKTTQIELVVYGYHSFAFIGVLRMSWWPEMYRQTIQKQLELPPPLSYWPQAVTRWTQEVYEPHRKPPTFGQPAPKDERPPATGSHAPSTGTGPRLSGTRVDSPNPSQQDVRQLSDPVPLLPSVQLALQNLPPLSELLWQTDQKGVPCCLMKVPHNVRFSDLSCIFETPRQPYHLSRADRHEPGIIFFYSTQDTPERRRVSQTSLFQPSSPSDWQLLTRLTQTSSVQLLGYSDDPTPRYLDFKSIGWAKHKRKAIREFLTRRAPDLTKSTPKASEMPQLSSQENEHASLELPAEARRSLAFSSLRGIITLPAGEQALPRIYIKVPQGTHFEEVAVAFGSLNLTGYPTGWVLSLSPRLQNAAEHVMTLDCLLNPISERRILRQLTVTQHVEMVALADIPTFPPVGAKLLTWPFQKRDRANTLLEYTRANPRPGPWNRARDEYLQEHPQEYMFQVPFPKTQQPRGTEEPPVSFKESRLTNHEERSAESEIPRTGPERQSAFPQGVPSTTAEHLFPLVERCVLLYRAGVQQEYARTHALSRRLFWSMMLALALEHTQRKFIWMPEAAQVTEEHRQHLTPGVVIPWLSSREHLWIEFVEPIETPTCSDTAALFIFSAADPSLLHKFARQVRVSSHALKALERDLYTPEKQQVILNVIDRTGAIAWAVSLKTNMQSQTRDTQGVWFAPAWYTCPTQGCSLHPGGGAVLCETCTATRTFVWTWFTAAWQSLLGLYRTQPEDLFGTIGEEHIERLTRPLSEPDMSEDRHRIDLEYRYRVVRSIDIATVPAQGSTEGVGHRDSWVKILAALDPALLFYDEREIPIRTRTLKHPRYAKYVEQHGTNQVEVRAHKKHVPMRMDPKAMTKVTAMPPQRETQEP